MPLARLRQAFRDLAVERIGLLETAMREVARGTAGANDSVRRLANSLRGSGASYGFPEITGAAASVVEASDADLQRSAQALLTALQNVVVSIPAVQRTVVVIDDDPVITALLSAALWSLDRTVVVAHTWKEGQIVLAGTVPAAIVLDLVLPDTDGRNAIVALRELPVTANTPIVVVSGALGVAPRAECLALGATAYVTKPFDPGAVVKVVDDVIRNAGAAAADWRVDETTGLFNRAGLTDLFGRSTGQRHVAVFGDPEGASLSAEVARAMTARAAKEALLARWDAGSICCLMEHGEGDQVRTLVDALLTAARGAGKELRVGVAPVADGESLNDAMARAVQRQLGASTEWPVNSRDESTRKSDPVLLAEDDAVVAMLVVERLRRAGIDVVHCANGLEAAEMAKTKSFSCAILDLKLPGLDGFAILNVLRNEGRSPGTPVAMLTSMGQEKDVTRGFELGADDYIVKPFSPRELSARVQRLILRGNGRRQ